MCSPERRSVPVVKGHLVDLLASEERLDVGLPQSDHPAELVGGRLPSSMSRYRVRRLMAAQVRASVVLIRPIAPLLFQDMKVS